MTEFLYTARRTADCDPAKVAAAREGLGVLELECSHCKAPVLAILPMIEGAWKTARLAGAELRLLCRQCAESQAGLPLAVQDAAVAIGGGAAIIADMTPPRGGDA